MQRYSTVKQLYAFQASHIRPRNRRKSIFARHCLPRILTRYRSLETSDTEPNDNHFPLVILLISFFPVSTSNAVANAVVCSNFSNSLLSLLRYIIISRLPTYYDFIQTARIKRTFHLFVHVENLRAFVCCIHERIYRSVVSPPCRPFFSKSFIPSNQANSPLQNGCKVDGSNF